jgi:hypothetical protein
MCVCMYVCLATAWTVRRQSVTEYMPLKRDEELGFPYKKIGSNNFNYI